MKAKNKINFTHRTLNSLTTPSSMRSITYFDTQVDNLNIIVTRGGSKTFYVRKNIDGQSKRVRLGAYPDLSVDNARNMALEIKSIIAKGQNPFEQQMMKKKEFTLNEMFEYYLEHHAKPHKKPYSIKSDISNYTNHIRKQIGLKKLSAISNSDIVKIHTAIGLKHPYMANRVLALLSSLFNKAIEWQIAKGLNPTNGIKKFKEKSRDRFLQKDELIRLFQALESESNHDIRDYVYLSLYTGARRSNVLAMQWSELDLDAGIWRIEETKNGETQNIPLVEDALAILMQRQMTRDSISPYIFSSHSKAGHMVEPKKGWKRIIENAGIENLRLHDLRRTLGSYQAINGTSLHIIGQSLGHKSLHTTQIYSRLTDDPIRSSMSEAVKAMQASHIDEVHSE